MVEQIFQKMGLSKEAADTYVTLLKLGTQPASTVARHLTLNRTTVRVYLETLVKFGFIRMTWKGNTQYFTPEKPEDALRAIQHQKQKTVEKFDQNLQAFKAVLPELNSITREDILLPRVTFYEGIDELKRMYLDTLNSKTDILCFSSIQDMWDLFSRKYDNWYVKKRVKNQIPVRILCHDAALERAEAKKDKKLLRKTRFIPSPAFNISNEINIYDGKVSIITLKNEKIGVLIQSQEIYHSMKVIFEQLWDTAKS